MDIRQRVAFTAHLRIEWGGVTPDYVRYQLRQTGISFQAYRDALAEWVLGGASYPEPEDKAAWGFYSPAEAGQVAGIDLTDDNLTHVNAWAYCSYCALQFIGDKLGVQFRPMRFVEYRQMVLKVSLIAQGMFLANERQQEEVVAAEVARSKMFTTNIIPHPVDRTAAQVTGM